jgi:hypothetical protein
MKKLIITLLLGIFIIGLIGLVYAGVFPTFKFLDSEIIESSDLNRNEFGLAISTKDDYNLINYKISDDKRFNITLYCGEEIENNVFINKNKFGADSTFKGLRNCTYVVESNNQFEKVNKRYAIKEKTITGVSTYHKFDFGDVCFRTFECYESGTIEGWVCNKSADCKYIEYKDEKNDKYFLNVTFISDNFIDPEIIITNVSEYDSLDVNITKEGYPFAHTSTWNSSLSLYLPFDIENKSGGLTYDYTSNDNDGVVSAGTTYDGGKYGGAYHLDSDSSSIITIQDDDSLDISTEGTWSFWVNQDNYVGAAGFIGKYVTSTGRRSWLFIESGGNEVQSFFSTDGTTYESDISGQNCGITQDGVWTMITLVYNTSHLIYYKNGTYCDIDTVTINSLHNSITKVTVGKDYSSHYYNGTIDEIMVWKRALSSTEISKIFDEQFERFSKPATQTFNFTNISQDGTYDRLNITTNSSQPTGTNLSVRVLQFDASNSSLTNTSWYNIENGTNQLVTITINVTTYYVRLEFNYSTDEYNFYTPLLKDDVLLESYDSGTTVEEEDCWTESAGGFASPPGCKFYKLPGEKLEVLPS